LYPPQGAGWGGGKNSKLNPKKGEKFFENYSRENL
jgi:hypothetical protein